MSDERSPPPGAPRHKAEEAAAASSSFTDMRSLSSITLIECANNFLKWSGTSIPNVLRAVTSTPAEMLGLKGVKGSLEPGADADLVIFSEETDVDGDPRLAIDEVWKFGSRVYHKSEPFSPVYSPIDSSPVSSSPEPESELAV